MSLAMKRLKNLGWLALVFLVAVLLYPLSLNVAALHSDLMRMDRQVLETKREINFLQAEIRTRASVQQLEEWNDLLYGYTPPTAEQFVNGEAALANLDGAPPVIKPVMVAVSGDGVSPSGSIGSDGRAKDGSDDNGGIRLAMLTNEAKPKLKVEAQVPEKPTVDKPVQSRTERLSKIDEKLLSDDFLNDIEKRSAKEQKRR